MSEALRLWLSQELDQRSWSHRELARQTGFSQAFVSKTLAGERKPSLNFCNKVAAALDVSPEMVLRLANILPGEQHTTESTDSPIAREILQLIQNMSLEQRKEALRYICYLSERNQDD